MRWNLKQFIVFLTLCLSFLGAVDCPTVLTHAQVGALRDADVSKTHVVRLVSKSIGGRTRLVVLVGEEHLKYDESELELGRRIVDLFPVRAVENVKTEKLRAARMMDAFIRFSYHWAQRLGRRRSILPVPEDIFSGSAMYYAVQDALRDQAARIILDGLELGLFNEHQLKDATISLGPNTEARVESAAIKKQGGQIPIAQLWQRIETLKRSPTSVPKRYIDLELNWQPSRGAQFSAGLVPVEAASKFTLCLTTICLGLAHIFEVPSEMTIAFFWSAGGLGLLEAKYQTARFMLPRVRQRNLLLNVIDPWQMGNVSRNENMVQNLLKALEKDPKLEVVLVMAGNDHIYGLEEDLIDQRGFTRHNLPR